jgi:hypothetical protein
VDADATTFEQVLVEVGVTTEETVKTDDIVGEED